MIIVGSLARQNWHRQIRQLNLDAEAAYNHVLGKTVAIAKEFGFSPMAIHVRPLKPVRETRAKLDEHGLIPITGIGTIALSNDLQVREDSISQARQALTDAAAIGSELCMFSLGGNGRVTHEGELKFAAPMLQQVGAIAADLGIRICTENMNSFSSDELIQICSETGLDNVGILNDTGNWLILGEDPVEATRKCLPYTLSTHVRDYAYENYTYNGVALGAGKVDFDSILPMLAQADGPKNIFFTVEVDTDDRDEDQCAHDSYSYLRDWLVKNNHTEGLAL